MRNFLVAIGQWLVQTFEAWGAVISHGAVSFVEWLGVGWLVVLGVIAFAMALWGLKVHRG